MCIQSNLSKTKMENIQHSNNKKYRKIGPYLLIKPIGKGTYSVVFEAKNQTTKQKFAIKQISLTNIHQKQRQRLGQQIKVLKMIKHPNIVSMVDYKQTSRNLYLVFQHCKHTDLGIYIDKYYGGKLPEEQVRRIVVQLKKAFQILRENKVVHRDLKLANILVTEQFQIKIADFGFAKLLDDNAYFKSYVGTPLTMAPEILDKLQYNEKCDIWSLGVVIYQMIYGCSPFFTQQKMTKTELKKALQSEVKYPFSISQLAKNLLNRAIVRDPTKRMSFQQFFNHPWIAEDNIEQQNQLYKNLKDEALRSEIKKNLLKSVRAVQQKEYIIQSAQNILAFCILEHVKNSIEHKLMYWVNLGKRIMDLHEKNKRLLYFSLAVILDNINLCKSSQYSVLVNEKRMIHIPEYMQLRKLQTWQMTQYTRRLPNFLEKSYKTMFEIFTSIEMSFTNTDLDKKLIQHFLQELVSQVQQNPESQNIGIFLKVKPYQGPLAYLKISSSTLSEKTTKLLLTNLKLTVQNSKLLKKCSQIFKIENIHREGQLDKLYQQMCYRYG